MRASITGAFGVPGENENGRRVVEFCAERGLCVDNTHFEHKSLHKYTRVARGQDGEEVKSMIDLVLLKEDMLGYVETDIKAFLVVGYLTTSVSARAFK